MLGAPVGADGRPADALDARLRAGANAFASGHAPRMIVTGAGEAASMWARLVELGVPREAILVEPHARSTRENALYCARLMQKEGWTTALVVTQRFHLGRSVRAFRRAGIDTEGLAAAGVPARPSQLAREVLALAAYAMRGWI